MKKNVNISMGELLYIRDLYESACGAITTSEFLDKHGEGAIKIGDFADKFKGTKLHSIESVYSSDQFSGRQLMCLSAMAILCHIHLLIEMGIVTDTDDAFDAVPEMGFSSPDEISALYLKINRILGDREDHPNAKIVMEKQ